MIKVIKEEKITVMGITEVKEDQTVFVKKDGKFVGMIRWDEETEEYFAEDQKDQIFNHPENGVGYVHKHNLMIALIEKGFELFVEPIN